ncbi:MAG: spoIIIAF [Clostridia bacterium]|jgi:stage III sporulation protein AF|nr:spoIIIAF [Clostridia bacterium]
MEFVKSWITNITVVIVFTMLLDILIPNNDMKKFVKVIMGLLIVLVIIKPLLMVKNVGYQFESTMAQTAAYIDDSTQGSNDSMEVFQNNTALGIYKQKLSDKVIEIVKSRDEFENRDVQVSVEIENDINNKEFGSIKGINVFVKKGKSGAVQASAIEPVNINTETVINKNQSEYNWNNSELSQDLSADINDALGLKGTKISLEIQE